MSSYFGPFLGFVVRIPLTLGVNSARKYVSTIRADTQASRVKGPLPWLLAGLETKSGQLQRLGCWLDFLGWRFVDRLLVLLSLNK